MKMSKINNTPSQEEINYKLVDLYKNIPDYSEVRHLTASEFIHRLEFLKQEYLKARTTLVDDTSDIDHITRKTENCLKLGDGNAKPEEKISNSLAINSCKVHQRIEDNYVGRNSRTLQFKRGDNFWYPIDTSIRNNFDSSRLQKLEARRVDSSDGSDDDDEDNDQSSIYSSSLFAPEETHVMLKNKLHSKNMAGFLSSTSRTRKINNCARRHKQHEMHKRHEPQKRNNSNAASNFYRSFGESKLFKASPSPTRNRNLLAATKLKEQQEYRQLRRHLRSKTLLENSSLPPRMAMHEKHRRHNNATTKKSDCSKSEDTIIVISGDETDDCTENSASTVSETVLPKKAKSTSKKTATAIKRKNASRKLRAALLSSFEPSPTGNKASRLRINSARIRKESLQQREKEEFLRNMKAKKKRLLLRESHLPAWKRATSYSALHDIEMRKELRTVASILEREEFLKNMHSMIRRVQSAPLLLEGRQGNKGQPCKQHRAELEFQSSLRKSYAAKSPEKRQIRWGSTYDFLNETDATTATAEGSLSPMTNSNNDLIQLSLDEQGTLNHENEKKEGDEDGDDNEESTEVCQKDESVNNGA